MFHIVILVHQNDRFSRQYLLHEIAEIWEEKGIRITVQQGPGPHVMADAAILHVDLTVVPQQYLAWIWNYPIVVNANVIDISKRRISMNLVQPEDGYRGPVIVKTNNNAAGRMEDQLARNGIGPRRQRARELLMKHRPMQDSGSAYFILESSNDVPDHIWFDEDLVVEKFLPELRDGFYCLRTWQFLGNCEINSLAFSKEPIVKARNVVRIEHSEVPPGLRQLRQHFEFDFGKFDYALVDGQLVLYDANRTPTLGNFPKERYLPLVRKLAHGLETFL